MAISEAAPRGAPADGGGSASSLPGLEHPLLHAYDYEPRKEDPDAAAAGDDDREAQSFGPDPGGGASFVRTCFNGLNALSGECPAAPATWRSCHSSFRSTEVAKASLFFLPISRRRAAVHPVRAVGGRVAEPGAPPRRRGGVLLHGAPPPALHGRVPGRPWLPRDRRARVRPGRPPRGVRVPLRGALPRRHRLPHPGRGQPRQALPGHQPQPRPPRRRRRHGLREAALRRARGARHPAHDVAAEPRRARVRVGQRRARVGRRGRLRALGCRGGWCWVHGAGEDAQCQWTPHGSGAVHLLLLRACHFPHALQLHEGKEEVLQGACHMLRRLHPELRIHGDPRLPHVRRRRQVPGDAEPSRGEAQLEAGHLHDAGQPVLQVRPDGDAARGGGRGEAARRGQQEEVRQHTDQDPHRRQHRRRRARRALLRTPHGARRLAPQRHGLDAAPLRLLPQDLRRRAVRQGGGRADRRDHRPWLPGCCHWDVLFSEEDCSRVLKKSVAELGSFVLAMQFGT